MILIGYSGHAFVAYDILEASGNKITGYCDLEEKIHNPFKLPYFGSEFSAEGKAKIREEGFFISVGENQVRKKIFTLFESEQLFPVNAIHPSATISKHAAIKSCGIMICAGVCINPLASIGNGAICNTGAIIEHECEVNAFAHIGPGAVLCGNVIIGEGSFVGAGAVIKQGISIGKNVTIGAGAVVVKNIGDNEIVVGNPSKQLIK